MSHLKLKTVLALAGAIGALGVSGAASASHLTPIASYVDPNGGTTSVLGINNAGAMTGSIGYADNSGVAFARSAGGVYTTFSNGGAFFTQGRAIGNNGTIRGFSWDSTQNLLTSSQFQRSSSGTVSAVTNPATGDTLRGIAQGMNNSGAAVGDYYTTVGGPPRHGYVLSGGTLTDLSVPGFPNRFLVARAITDTGTVVGWGNNGGVTEGYILSGGTYHWFADPAAAGGGTTNFEDINSHGLISGEYTDTGGFTHAFVFDSTTDAFTNINVPGAANSEAFGLNDWGQVVITTDLPTGPNNFIYNTVPEPATWAVMMLGVFGVGGAMRRRRLAAA